MYKMVSQCENLPQLIVWLPFHWALETTIKTHRLEHLRVAVRGLLLLSDLRLKAETTLPSEERSGDLDRKVERLKAWILRNGSGEKGAPTV